MGLLNFLICIFLVGKFHFIYLNYKEIKTKFILKFSSFVVLYKLMNK